MPHVNENGTVIDTNANTLPVPQVKHPSHDLYKVWNKLKMQLCQVIKQCFKEFHSDFLKQLPNWVGNPRKLLARLGRICKPNILFYE